MKYKPFFYINKKYFKAITFGIDRLFTIKLHLWGLIFDFCHVGTILKKVTYSIEPWKITKVNY